MGYNQTTLYFVYYDLGNQDLIAALKDSELKNAKTLIVEIGYSGPVLEVKTNDFINYWEEILHASVEGFPVISRDGKYLLEFIKNPEVIYSNFLIGSIDTPYSMVCGSP